VSAANLTAEAQRTQRRGDWTATFSGVKWFITDPHPDDVRIADIAHALSLICRYGGHCREFYSVAQHSVIVAKALWMEFPKAPGLVLHALLHDAGEAYLGDVVRPLKATMPQYKALEHLTEGVIAVALNLPPLTQEQRAILKHFDDVALMTERRDLVNHCGHEWTLRAKPLVDAIRPWSPEVAELAFLEAYRTSVAKLEGGLLS
jgi:hypothetical protein